MIDSFFLDITIIFFMTARSPVFSHLAATLTGLSTIRANAAQQKITEEFDDLQNVHSAVWQLTMSSNAALGLWLDCISTGFVACVTFSFILLHEGKHLSNSASIYFKYF